MSSFTGVTFAEQAVTPSDDAIVRRAILPDGILSGCELSYSGSTLTMAAGHLMVCGRQIRHPSAQNWAVVDATSGYARLLLTIDLTRTATEEAFDQVVDSIEYASAKNGFVDLEQADINRSGTRYQVAVCVVSLGTGGITGIVSKLEKCEVGAGLNFNVVGGTTRPSDPKENTIWVKTASEITSWTFSASQPSSPKAGAVWIKTSASSAVAFNALKKNVVMAYPVSAQQYSGSTWNAVPAETYQNGKWKSWTQWLYNKGDQCTSLTGGYAAKGLSIEGYIAQAPTLSSESSKMTLRLLKTGETASGIVYSKTKVDLSSFGKLNFAGTGAGRYSTNVMLCVWSDLNGTKVAEISLLNYTTRQLDISSLSGLYYVGFQLTNSDPDTASVITVSELYLS